MCRSSIGADAALDSVLGDATKWPRPNTWQDPYHTADERPSLFKFLLDKKADPTVKDFKKKSALHHLLESEDTTTYTDRPTKIRNSLLYMLNHHGSLLYEPDSDGKLSPYRSSAASTSVSRLLFMEFGV